MFLLSREKGKTWLALSPFPTLKVAVVFGGVAAMLQLERITVTWALIAMSCWTKASSSLPPDCLLCVRKKHYWFKPQLSLAFYYLQPNAFLTNSILNYSFKSLYLLYFITKVDWVPISQTFIYWILAASKCLSKLTHENTSHEQRPYIHWPFRFPPPWLFVHIFCLLIYCTVWLFLIDFKRKFPDSKIPLVKLLGNSSLHFYAINQIKHDCKR